MLLFFDECSSIIRNSFARTKIYDMVILNLKTAKHSQVHSLFSWSFKFCYQLLTTYLNPNKARLFFICYMLISLAFFWQGNVKKSKKLMTTVNIDGENPRIFWTTGGTSINFLGKMWLKIILKFTKNQRFTLSLEDLFLEKPQGGSN